MDIIFIEKLIIMASIGIYKWEQKKLQKLVFDIKMGYNNDLVVNNENIKYFVDYSKVSKIISSLMKEKHFSLVETVAEKTAKRLIDYFQLQWIHIKLSKPEAIPIAKNVGVIIERKNSFK